MIFRKEVKGQGYNSYLNYALFLRINSLTNNNETSHMFPITPIYFRVKKAKLQGETWTV